VEANVVVVAEVVVAEAAEAADANLIAKFLNSEQCLTLFAIVTRSYARCKKVNFSKFLA
jgi:hypothetical protein